MAGRNGLNRLNERRTFGASTPREPGMDGAAARMFRAAQEEEALIQTAEPVDIFAIEPNPMQPRRAVPSAARAGWNGDPAGVSELLARWWGLAQDELGAEIDLREIVLGSAPDPADDEAQAEDAPARPLSSSLLTLAGLAASIRRDGLTNPVTVVQYGDARYLLETGERRWLAHHLLYWVTQNAQWARIPARLVPQVDLWRQATENNARADLTAIGKARQLALLLMDLLAREGYTFYPFDAFDHEQDFYAQVADGNAFRVPRGKSEMLLRAMGLQNAVQLRQYRALLRLPAEIWLQADDESWTERKCRPWVDGDTVTVVTVSDEDSPALPGGAGGEAEKAFDMSNALPAGTSRPAKLMPKEVQQGVRYLTSLKDVPGEQREREALRARIQATRAWLDELERRL